MATPVSKCIKAMVKQSKGLISEAEAKTILKELDNRIMNEMKRKTGKAPRNRALVAEEQGRLMTEEMDLRAKLRKRANLFNLKAYNTLKESLGDDVLGKQAALKAQLVGHPGITMFHVDAIQKGYQAAWTDGFADEMIQAGALESALKGGFDKELAIELAELQKTDGTGKPGRTQHKEAIDSSKLIHKWQKFLMQREKQAGGWVGELDSFIEKQTYQPDKLRKMGKKRFIEAMTERVDRSKTLVDVAEDDMLEVYSLAFDALVTGQHFRHGKEQFGIDEIYKNFNLSPLKTSQSRIFHFKTPEDFAAHTKEFGNDTITETFLSSMDLSASRIAVFERLGPNFEEVINRVRKDIIAELRPIATSAEKLSDRDKAISQINKLALKGERQAPSEVQKGAWRKVKGFFLDMTDILEPSIDDILAELDGKTKTAINATWAARMSATRAAISMSKLTSSTLSSFTDIHNLASEIKNQGGRDYLQALEGLRQNYLKDRPPEIQRSIKKLIGVYSGRILSEIHSRIGAIDNLPKTIAKKLNAFFKIIGQRGWDEIHKTAFMDMMLADFADSAKLKFSALPGETQRLLKQYNFDESTWPLFKKITEEFPDATRYLVPERVADLDDNFIKSIMKEKSPTARQVKLKRDELSSQIFTMLTNRMDHAIAVPGAAVNATFLRSSQPGTPLGDALRFVRQFKGFPMSHTMNNWMRVIQGNMSQRATETGVRGVIEGFKYGKGIWAGMSQMMVGMTAFGYLSMTAKDITKNRSLKDPTDPTTWKQAFMQGGGLGIYGDFLFGEFNRFGSSPLETFMGPAASDFSDLLQLWSKFSHGDDFAASFVKTMFNNMGAFAFMPGVYGQAAQYMNTWYTRGAFDYMFTYQLQEALNPGFLKRTQQRMKSNSGQEFLIQPF